MWPLHQQITEPGEQESQQKALKEQLRDLPCLSPMGQRHPQGQLHRDGAWWAALAPGNPTGPQTCKGQGLAWGCKRGCSYYHIRYCG